MQYQYRKHFHMQYIAEYRHTSQAIYTLCMMA